MSWPVTKAKAKFSGLLTAVQEEGPQLIHRRGEEFILSTRKEMEKRFEEARTGKRRRFISAFEALRPPFDERYEFTMKRGKNGTRWVEFE